MEQIKKRETLVEKQELLEKAAIQLKTEFVGIDNVIDEVITGISSWFLFPDIQSKPLIINLWGLTGTGKSSLIKRLSELIDYDKRYFRVDLGNQDNRYALRETVDELCSIKDDHPVILSLDEFQHARTKKGPFGQEVDSDKNRVVWELLDTGVIQYLDYRRGLWSLEEDLKKYKFLVQSGKVKVHNGIITAGKGIYCKEMDIKSKPKLPFVEPGHYEIIIDFLGDELGLYLFQDLESLLMKYNEQETLELLELTIKSAHKPTSKDLSNSLIFVIGNLDEAYMMSSDFTVDLSANEFHEQSLKINLTKVKSALQERFRNEQIARLGNNHIIYPAFSENSYRSIIQMQLKKLTEDIKRTEGHQLVFDQSIEDVIYAEGVFPTQGTRPVFTTIEHLIKSKLSKVIIEAILNKVESAHILFSFSEDRMKIDYRVDGDLVHHIELFQKLELSKQRENKGNDLQAITAVHESGHAICSIFLMNTIPEVVYSVTADEGSSGFAFMKYKWKYISKKEITNRLATLLGGFIAEKVIFGADNVTTGSESDFQAATKLVSRMLRDSGMGDNYLSTHIPSVDTADFYFDHSGDINRKIQDWITKASVLCEQELIKQMPLLIQLSNYLSDNTVIKKELMEKLAVKYGKGFSAQKIITSGDDLYYRKKLKELVKALPSNIAVLQEEGHNFILNKDENNAAENI